MAKDVLRNEIDAALAAPPSLDPLQDAKQEFGLRFLIELRPGQSPAAATAFFEELHPAFRVGPFFDLPAPEEEAQERDARLLAANLFGVSADDLSVAGTDIAAEAQRELDALAVEADLPVAQPTRPADAPPLPSEAEVPCTWVHKTLKVAEAWKLIEARRRLPGSGIDIGHPDTGYTPHEVFGNTQLNLAKQRNFLQGEGEHALIALDRVGTANYGHGTSTASVMVGRRGGPLEGVAPNAQVVPIRCIKSVFVGPPAQEVVNAVRWARLRDCQVISLSLGGVPNWLNALWEEISRALEANIIVVAAAGQYVYIPRVIEWPTADPAHRDTCIGVAGIEGRSADTYTTWWLSHRNPKGSIQIAAPATPIRAAIPGNGYHISEGTSYATALLAGIAALWLSYHFPNGYRGVWRAQISFLDHLMRTRVQQPGFDPYFAGMVDAEALIRTTPRTQDAETAEVEQTVEVLAR